jgi:nitrous oxide reductase accessory protein NosL
MTARRLAVLVVFFAAAWIAFPQERPPAKPGPGDKCPVCGMFIAKYQDFLAQVIFKDGTPVFFDGAKDMFKYLLDPGKIHPGRAADDVAAIYVTDYYSLTLVDGRRAFFVAGSDIYGPMGRELIPMANEADAKEFMHDHKGSALLKFKDVTAAVVKGLD